MLTKTTKWTAVWVTVIHRWLVAQRMAGFVSGIWWKQRLYTLWRKLISLLYIQYHITQQKFVFCLHPLMEKSKFGMTQVGNLSEAIPVRLCAREMKFFLKQNTLSLYSYSMQCRYGLVTSLFMSFVIREFCGWSDVTFRVTTLTVHEWNAKNYNVSACQRWTT